jgi:hypothetical protein
MTALKQQLAASDGIYSRISFARALALNLKQETGESMFRIEVFVEDKRLAEALLALAGLARGQPNVMPVANLAEGGKKNGELKAATSGTALAMLEAHLRKNKTTDLTPQDIRVWLKSVGRSSASASSLATEAVKHRLLKRTGRTGNMRYTVTKRKA